MNSFSNSHDYCDERGYVVPLYGYQYQKTSEESEEIFIIYQRAFASARGMVKLAHIKLSIAKCLLTKEGFSQVLQRLLTPSSHFLKQCMLCCVRGIE